MNQTCALAIVIFVTHLSAVVRSADPADTHPDLHLIPWPKAIQARGGHLEIAADARIVAQNKQLMPLAAVLSSELKVLTSLDLELTSGPARAGDIVLRMDPEIRADEPILMLRNRELLRTTDGAHSIEVDGQATITGSDYRATAEGSSTLLQLLGRVDGTYRLPRVMIKDWPHAEYCGVMLDVARQDHPLADVKKVVQLCRMYKARYLQLHLTDEQGWTFPSTTYPQLGTKNYGAHGGIAPRLYKLEELKELVAYADARGVTIVPEFELPGHSGAAVRALPDIFDAIHPESKQPIGIGCMNMSNEAIYPAIDTIIGEMCEVFDSSPYFHIGSDEVTSGRLSLNPTYQEFLDKHGLKDEHELADHFVREVCAIVKKHGKKAIKWEGLANFATKDVVIMCWEGNSTFATAALARGYTIITCPWNLAVPWEQWNMYSCNASQLKPGDSVLGATLVAWEQPPLTHVTNLRQLAHRQERTWGPDNQVTVAGFAARFRPLDAVAGKLIDLPPKAQHEPGFSTSMGTQDFLDPVFALDGDDATFYRSATNPQPGDQFTISFKKPRSLYAINVLTGLNGQGRLEGGELQVSTDGTRFESIATLKDGEVRVVLKDNRVQAVRLRATVPETSRLVVRTINLQSLVELSGVVTNPGIAVGTGNVAALRGDTEFTYPIGACATPVVNHGFTLKLNNGGNPYSYSGPISGRGNVELHAAGPQAPLVLDGPLPNTLEGTWLLSGQVVLAKPPGVDALCAAVVVRGDSHHDSLVWNASHQIHDTAKIQLRRSDKGVGQLKLNGHREKIACLELDSGSIVQTSGTDDGVLAVTELVVDGKSMPAGVYTSSEPWLKGGGYVVVGDVGSVDVSGIVEDPSTAIGDDRIANLKGATTFQLLGEDCSTTAITGNHVLTLSSDQATTFSGFVTGHGGVQVTAAADHRPLEISGRATNSYRGATTLARGLLKLNKSDQAVAIPGNLTLGGSAVENLNDGVIWERDGQISATAVVTLQGTQPSFLDLNGHRANLSKVVLSRSAQVRTGKDGTLSVKQLFVEGQRIRDGEYDASHPWLTGSGKVTVDARVDVQGVVGSPDVQIGTGNVANLTGRTTISYPANGCHVDVLTNGYTLVLDSGDGNGFSCTGSISGTGSVEFFMGPSYTSYKDAPMPISGDRPNTTSGKFLVRKGRVQLEKPRGIDAISGDVIVGGQGFNDCLFWKHSDQLKDDVHITLIDAGSNGAAYLDLNGCSETAAGLTMTRKNRVKTMSSAGVGGMLTVKALTISGIPKPAGTYTSETQKWIEGNGKVLVTP